MAFSFEDIFEYEKKARGMTADAEAKFRSAEEAADALERRLADKALAKAKRDAENMLRKKRLEAEQRSDEQEHGGERKIAEMLAAEKENSEKWSDEIVRRVVTGS